MHQSIQKHAVCNDPHMYVYDSMYIIYIFYVSVFLPVIDN